jgi:hypothetical protein
MKSKSKQSCLEGCVPKTSSKIPLHTEWAMKHLTLVNKMVRRLDQESNLNTMDFLQALVSEAQKKIKEDPDYAEANRILSMLEQVKL